MESRSDWTHRHRQVNAASQIDGIVVGHRDNVPARGARLEESKVAKWLEKRTDVTARTGDLQALEAFQLNGVIAILEIAVAHEHQTATD